MSRRPTAVFAFVAVRVLADIPAALAVPGYAVLVVLIAVVATRAGSARV